MRGVRQECGQNCWDPTSKSVLEVGGCALYHSRLAASGGRADEADCGVKTGPSGICVCLLFSAKKVLDISVKK